jgi:hypothetical protein
MQGRTPLTILLAFRLLYEVSAEKAIGLTFDAGNLHVELWDKTFTVRRMNVSVSGGGSWSNSNNFSFVPERNAPRGGCHNLGDFTFRVRPQGKDEWAFFSSASADGSLSASPISHPADYLAAHDITSLIEQDTTPKPAFGLKSPLRVVRSWKKSDFGGKDFLTLQVEVVNVWNESVEIGGFGLSMPAAGMTKNIKQAVWEDPHIGMDHGWVEFVRVVDGERTLLAVPEYSAREKEGPSDNQFLSSFEAWRPIMENTCGNNVWEYAVLSKAWAEDWSQTKQYPFLYMADFLNKTGT